MYRKFNNFVVKLRAYPTREQKEKIDKILYGVRVAYNTTAYEIDHGNEKVTNPDKKDETVRWPNFSACMKKPWLDFLREQYPAVCEVPSKSLSSSVYSIFKDMKKSWETYHPEIVGTQKTKHGKPCFKRNGDPVWAKSEKPVKLPCGKWKPSYYSNSKPRTSFTVQTRSSGFDFIENSKTVMIGVSCVGKVKTRGWRFDIRFGENGDKTFIEEYGGITKDFGVTVSKDNCGDYWIIVKLQTAWVPDKTVDNKHPIGVDVGVTDLAVTSDGVKYPNKKFKAEEKGHKRRLDQKLSRQQGWKNEEFREAHRKDRTLKPSKGYERTALKNAKLERKVVRRRNNHNNNVSIDIVRDASFIGIENLDVSGMMINRHTSFSVADAGMYDLLSKIKYKAEVSGVPIVQIGRWEPSSQLCHVCGYRNRKVKNTSVRDWICPKCGTHHDRDINAAINIKNIALNKCEM